MNRKLLIPLTLLVSGFCLAQSRLALAAEDIEDFFAMSPAELANMPVTIATGTPTPMYQSAAITSVITADQIKSMGATELHEVLETVPGVHASLQEGSYDYSYTIRGINSNASAKVLFLLNGTRMTTPFQGRLMTTTELPIDAIERVEVIRGPGSALYGADAFAGVINIITKKADDIKGSKVGVRAGNFDTESAWGQQSAEWAGWQIAANLQYQHSNNDERKINADFQTTLDHQFGTSASHAPGALNARYEALNGHLNLQRKHWDIGLWGFSSIDAGTRAGNAAALDPKGVANGQQYLADIRYSTEDWSKNWELIAHASYLRASFLAALQAFPDQAQIPIGNDGNISFMPGTKLVKFTNGVNANIGRLESIPFIELTSIYKGLNKHLLRFNTGFRHEEITTSESKNFGPGIITTPIPDQIDGQQTDLTGTPYIYLANTHRSVWSLVAQDEWQIAKQWQLTAGGRYDQYSDFGGTINPRLALVWTINEQLASKLLYGRAFRAPTFSELGTQNNPAVLGNKNLQPETIDTVEWVFDYRPQATLRTALNLYYYEIAKVIQPKSFSSNQIPQYRNNGNQNGYGFEYEWDWQFSRDFNIKGNYAWQHTADSSDNISIAGTPEHHIFAALVWRFLPKWQIQPQLNWIGGRTNQANDLRALNDYQTIDFTVRGKKILNHLNLSASLRNAFDSTMREPAVLQLPENLPLAGRSFYFEASVDF